MLGACLIVLLFFGQEEPKPLPERQPFLAEVRRNLEADRTILSRYTYTEKETHTELDSNQKPRKTEVKVYEVFPAYDPELTYRRLISKNGVPTSPKELERQDSDERKRKKKSAERLAKDKEKADKEDKEVLDELFALYDIELVRREMLNGRPTIVVTFNAKPNYKPARRAGNFLKNVAGRAWVDESDHHLVRVDAEAIDTISLGLGMLARIHKGTRMLAERRKFNDEVWLPIRFELEASARVLLLKGLRFREVTEYSNHQKFNADTILSFPDVEASRP